MTTIVNGLTFYDRMPLAELRRIARGRDVMIPFLGLSGGEDGEYVRVVKSDLYDMLEDLGQTYVEAFIDTTDTVCVTQTFTHAE